LRNHIVDENPESSNEDANLEISFKTLDVPNREGIELVEF
jgi:DNA repair protein RecN (Recombination protein N)